MPKARLIKSLEFMVVSPTFPLRPIRLDPCESRRFDLATDFTKTNYKVLGCRMLDSTPESKPAAQMDAFCFWSARR